MPGSYSTNIGHSCSSALCSGQLLLLAELETRETFSALARFCGLQRKRWDHGSRSWQTLGARQKYSKHPLDRLDVQLRGQCRNVYDEAGKTSRHLAWGQKRPYSLKAYTYDQCPYPKKRRGREVSHVNMLTCTGICRLVEKWLHNKEILILETLPSKVI
jgi:hypothetical protein